MVWNAYHYLHGTSYMFVYFVSQCIHWGIPTSIFLETFYEDLLLNQKYFSSEKVTFPAMLMKLVMLSVLASFCKSGYEGSMLVWVITPSWVRYPMWPEGEIHVYWIWHERGYINMFISAEAILCMCKTCCCTMLLDYFEIVTRSKKACVNVKSWSERDSGASVPE